MLSQQEPRFPLYLWHIINVRLRKSCAIYIPLPDVIREVGFAFLNYNEL